MIVTSLQELEELAPQWDELHRRSPNATPFQSPHWLLPWWRAFGSDEPYVITSSSDGKLEALAPLYILRDENESLGIFIGTGITDYLDILGDIEPLADAIASADCQVWDFQGLRPSSPLLSMPLANGWSDNVEDQDACPILALDEMSLSSHAQK